MEVFHTIINWVLDLGSAIFVPMIIFILGLVVKMPVRRAFTSALTLGVAFTGMNMVIGFMTDSVTPATEAMAVNTGINLPAIDMGWTAAASITWSWPHTLMFFAVQIIVNIIMLSLNWTNTLNVDMWNVWGKGLTAYLVYHVSGHLWAGYLAAIIQVVLELKMGDMFQKHIEDITGIPMVTVTHPMSLSAVLMMPINWLMDKIPFFNKKMDAEALKDKIGIFSENSVMGFIIGVLLGFAGKYSVSEALNLGIQVTTAMTLFPMVSKLFMQALSPLSDEMQNYMQERFKGRQVYIGMDWPVLAGSSEVWVTLIIMVPIFILYALVLPGNKVLPIASVLNYSVAVGSLLLTGGNLIRMLVIGLLTMPIYIYGSTYLAPILTNLAQTTGAVDVPEGNLISWASIELPEYRIFFAEAFNGKVWAIVCLIVFLLLFVWLYKYMTSAKIPSEKYE